MDGQLIKIQMNSAGIFSETWNEQNYLEENDETDEIHANDDDLVVIWYGT